MTNGGSTIRKAARAHDFFVVHNNFVPARSQETCCVNVAARRQVPKSRLSHLGVVGFPFDENAVYRMG